MRELTAPGGVDPPSAPARHGGGERDRSAEHGSPPHAPRGWRRRCGSSPRPSPRDGGNGGHSPVTTGLRKGRALAILWAEVSPARAGRPRGMDGEGAGRAHRSGDRLPGGGPLRGGLRRAGLPRDPRARRRGRARHRRERRPSSRNPFASSSGSGPRSCPAAPRTGAPGQARRDRPACTARSSLPAWTSGRPCMACSRPSDRPDRHPPGARGRVQRVVQHRIPDREHDGERRLRGAAIPESRSRAAGPDGVRVRSHRGQPATGLGPHAVAVGLAPPHRALLDARLGLPRDLPPPGRALTAPNPPPP